jgi:RimJ/RimL family protein N-acetyltransferase
VPAGVIGGIGIFHREGVQRFTKELGYWLGQEFWGQGIGAAAVTAFLGYIWATFPEAVRVEAVVYDYNDR